MKGQLNTRCLLKIAGPILALRCRRAAQRDENNGFPFTAAMEWRKAAELSSWITLLANRYWQEWEGIMKVPRRLAEPIGAIIPGYSPACDSLHCGGATLFRWSLQFFRLRRLGFGFAFGLRLLDRWFRFTVYDFPRCDAI